MFRDASKILLDLTQKKNPAFDDYERIYEATVRIADVDYLQFLRDDYLNYSTDKSYDKIFAKGVSRRSFFTNPELCGTSSKKRILEKTFTASLKSFDSLIFGGYYQAWASFFSTVVKKGDTIYYASECNPVIHETMKLSAGSSVKFSISAISELESLLRDDSSPCEKYIIVEGVYSANGQMSPLIELYEMSFRRSAHLVVDETTAFGVLGESGMGAVERAGLLGKDVSQVLGFSKALGSMGAAILSIEEVTKCIQDNAVAYRSSESLSGPMIFTALSSLEAIKTAQLKRSQLRSSSLMIYDELNRMGFAVASEPGFPVVSICFSSLKELDNFLSGMRERGILVNQSTLNSDAVRHYARISICAAHSKLQLAQLLESANEVGKRLSII